MLEEARLEHNIEHRVCGRDRKRIAAKRRTVRTRRHADGRFAGGQTGAYRKAAAKRFCQRHHIRRDAEALVGKQLAGAAHASLHLVENQEQAVGVTQLAQRPKERMRRGAHPTFALQRLDQDARGVRTDCFLDRFEFAERHLVEAIHRRPETLKIFRRTGGGQGCQCPSVKRAIESDDAITLWLAFCGVIFARDLDRAFHGFRTGIGEENKIGKTCFAKPCRQPLAIRALEQV